MVNKPRGNSAFKELIVYWETDINTHREKWKIINRKELVSQQKQAHITLILVHFLQISVVIIMRAPLAVLGGSSKLYWFTILKSPTCLCRVIWENIWKDRRTMILRMQIVMLSDISVCGPGVFLVHFDAEMSLWKDIFCWDYTLKHNLMKDPYAGWGTGQKEVFSFTKKKAKVFYGSGIWADLAGQFYSLWHWLMSLEAASNSWVSYELGLAGCWDSWGWNSQGAPFTFLAPQFGWLTQLEAVQTPVHMTSPAG